ncbi:MAG TPA: hypothetical protein VHZ27_14325, partial [Solirubrobacteraceae bacterium]|nr:hypothetical protein [Solirubrobacteraceae bacterium]
MRARFPAQLRVKVDAPPDWARALDGVRSESVDDEGALLTIDPGTDTQKILRAAQAAGPVEHFAFADAGALVARQEEVQFVTTPIGFVLLIGYLLVYAVIADPDATWVKVVSFLPPLTASLMPA